MILLVGRTGTNELGGDRKSVKAVRLHNHGGGGPTSILAELVEATQLAA